MSVKFSYKVQGDPSPEDLELMRMIDERMKNANREVRHGARAALLSEGKSNFGFRYKVTMPDGTVVDQGDIPVSDPDLAEAIRRKVDEGKV